MAKQKSSLFNVGLILGIIGVMFGYVFISDSLYMVSGATSSNTVTANVAVPSTCFTVISNAVINFGSVAPSQSTSLSFPVTVNDPVGNNAATIYIDGTNWISINVVTQNYFASNTAWSMTFAGAFSTGNALGLTFVNTGFTTTPSVSNTFQFGTAVPAAQTANEYSQTINIQASC